jgi:hypothetical protein
VEPVELLRFVVDVLERLGLRYLVTGSTASAVYGEPRYTNDLDIVVDLPLATVGEFCAAFPANEFYVSLQAAVDAVRESRQFNVIHPGSGLKIDVIIATESDFDRSRLERGRVENVQPGRDVTFASPEDVVLKKMVYFLEGGSEKHLRDIAGILTIQGPAIDRGYIERWAAELGVFDVWMLVLERTARGPTDES